MLYRARQRIREWGRNRASEWTGWDERVGVAIAISGKVIHVKTQFDIYALPWDPAVDAKKGMVADVGAAFAT